MPILEDPEQVLKDHKSKPAPSMIISWLLYPVVLLVGMAVGIAIGVKEAPKFVAEKNNNKKYSNTKIIVNLNTNSSNTNNANRNTNTVSNGNTNSSILNSNIFRAGDSAKLDAATEAKLQSEKQAALTNLVDRTLSMADVLRQQDLIDLQYSLKAYYAVRGSFPSTDGVSIKLERTDADVFYQSMKEFYGGSFYEKIDPESPKYYYGYKSDGNSYSLSALLTSKNKAFVLTSDSE